MATKKGLGAKGLGIEALIHNKMEDFESDGGGVMELDLNKIEPNRKQPRKYFDETALEELATSLKNYGMIQPVVVKKNKEGYYELIAGERRWRAAKIAGLTKIPAIIKKWEEGEAFEAALVENLQREDLNPMEEAQSYQRLQEEFGLSQEQIADKVGKSRPAVANALRLLQLDERVRNFVVENKLTAGHARALLPLTDGEAQFELAEHIIEEGLSVRAVEAMVKGMLETAKKPAAEEEVPKKTQSPVLRQIEDELKGIFATKVKVTQKKNKGKIEIEYYSDEDLDRLLVLMKKLETERKRGKMTALTALAQKYALLLFGLLGLAVVILFILCIILFAKINREKKRYDIFMGTSRRPPHNLEMKIQEYFDTAKGIEEKYDKLLDMVTDMDKTDKSKIQKVGLIRYNPFEEMGGNLCFALALLDGEDNGVVLNGIHSRTGSFTYAKPIEMGVSIYMLSDEEKQAVKMAQEQSYKPEHEKVVKVKFKPFFKRRYAPMDDQLTLEQVDTPKEKIQSIGDVTTAEQEQIREEETLAGQIAAAEDFSPEDAEKMLAEIQQETLDFFEDESEEMNDFEESEEKEKHQAE